MELVGWFVGWFVSWLVVYLVSLCPLLNDYGIHSDKTCNVCIT
jgi:hypothetical protein